jgi:virginiamycin B lyase
VSLAAVGVLLSMAIVAPAHAIRLQMLFGGAPEAMGIAGDAAGGAWMIGQFGGLAHITADGSTVYPGFHWQGSEFVSDITHQEGHVWVVHGGVLKKYTETGQQRALTPTAPTGVGALTRGPDGTIWFARPAAGEIGRVARDGSVTLFPGASPGALASGSQIAFGADGNVWFTEAAINRVGRLTPSGSVTEFPLPPDAKLLGGITAGRDGNLYLSLDGSVGRLSTAGILTGRFVGETAGLAPRKLVSGPDGSVWFSESFKPYVSRLRLPEGRIERLPLEGNPQWVQPSGSIDVGPDGTLWFFEWSTSRPARILFDPPAAATAQATLLGDGRARLSGAAAGRGVTTSVAFEYGPTTAYGATTAPSAATEADALAPVEAVTAALEPGTTYHYRVVASNSVGRAVGEDRTFTTPAPPPPPYVEPVVVAPGPPDADGDGFPAGVDCDDTRALTHPGATEVPMNRHDDDCAGGDVPYPRFAPLINASWNTSKKYVVFNRFSIDYMPARASLRLTCRGTGCKVKSYTATTSRDVRGLDLLKRLKRSRLRRNAVVELRLSRPGHITTVTRWKVGPPARQTVLCLPPGVKAPRKC